MRMLLVSGVIGRLTKYFSIAFLPPLLMACWDQEWKVAGAFALSAFIALITGRLMGAKYTVPKTLYRAEAMSVVAGTWLFSAFMGAIPYLFEGFSWFDAFFESMSGMTATGATILTDFDAHGRAFYLWRAMTQWFGGLGVIALFVVVLPRLGIAGRQLFFAEASGATEEDLDPQVRKSAERLWILYCGVTIVCALALIGAGMNVFEGFVHALTTVSAGGFSPHPESIAGYNNPNIEWILVGFMFLAGVSYPLQYRVVTGKWLGFFRDEEWRLYTAVALVGALGLAFILSDGSFTSQSLREGAFQAASLMSSTGYASTDYNTWGEGAIALLIFVMLIGGCAGSAAAGPKVIRYVLIGKAIRREIRQALHPRAVLPLRYMGRSIPDQIMRAVVVLGALYIAGYFLIGGLLVIMGTDPTTGFSAALACLGNIGHGLGTVGPMSNFAQFGDGAKTILTLAMWIGRLEILTVLALLHPDVWRHLHWTRS
jgi:trk system potassium uptake protein TrkH